jgi:hypothetical protein
LIIWDAILSGSFLLSILVCPVWLLLSGIRGLIRRPGWRVGLFRALVPVLTLALVLANAAVQSNIARANAQRIITATERFHTANGRYPGKLEDLVPQYLASVPRAKYALMFGEFGYVSTPNSHGIMWVGMPPFGRPFYKFEEKRWGYLD